MTRKAPPSFVPVAVLGILPCNDGTGAHGVSLDMPQETARRPSLDPASAPYQRTKFAIYRNEYDRICQSSASSGHLYEMGSPFDGRKFFPELRSSNAEASDA